MNQTQKWIRGLVLGSLTMGVIGLVNTNQAKAASDMLAKFQRPYREREWRQSHPNWNGRYYWHNHTYYFDRAYTQPAIVDHEWSTIGGGVVLDTDPYVSISGTYGSLYPIASLDIDLGSSDRNRHARALYFQHPYFWREGVRYDRTIVTRSGTRYYRFVKHRY